MPLRDVIDGSMHPNLAVPSVVSLGDEISECALLHMTQQDSTRELRQVGVSIQAMLYLKLQHG